MNKLGAEYETCGCMTAKDLVHADALRRAPDRTPGQTYVRIHVLVYTINVVALLLHHVERGPDTFLNHLASSFFCSSANCWPLRCSSNSWPKTSHSSDKPVRPAMTSSTTTSTSARTSKWTTAYETATKTTIVTPLTTTLSTTITTDTLHHNDKVTGPSVCRTTTTTRYTSTGEDYEAQYDRAPPRTRPRLLRWGALERPAS